MSDLTTEPMPMSEQPGSAPVDASMMLPQVHEWTISSAGEALRNGSITSVELLQQCLALADAYDDTFGVFITRTTEAALERAAAADAELADGIDRGPLHGIPLAVKDILSTADATERGRNPDGPSGVGADGAKAHARRHAGATPGRGTSWPSFGIPGIAMDRKWLLGVGEPDGELQGGRLADEDCTAGS